MGKRDLIDDDYGIPIHKWHTSVNAFTFRLGSRCDGYVYIKNLLVKKPIINTYKKLGLHGFLKARSETLSEICFLIYSGSVGFGVVNFESRLPDAFRDDVDYLKGVCDALGQYYSIMFLKSDKEWLRYKFFGYSRIHELKQYVIFNDSLQIFSEKALRVLKENIMFDDKRSGFCYENNNLNFGTIHFQIINWIHHNYDVYDDKKKNGLISMINNNISGDYMLNRSIGDVIISIIQNTIQNILKYGDYEKDSISIFLQQGENQDSDVIRIRCVSNNWHDDIAFEAAAISPRIQAKEMSYGLFLIGALVRIYGGVVLVGGNIQKGIVVIECCIPVSIKKMPGETIC